MPKTKMSTPQALINRRQRSFEVDKIMESSQIEDHSATDIREDSDEASNVFKKVKECLKRPESGINIAHSQTGDYAELLRPSTSHCATTTVQERPMCRETSEYNLKMDLNIENMWQEQRQSGQKMEKLLLKISTTVNEQQQTMSMIEHLLNEWLLKKNGYNV